MTNNYELSDKEKGIIRSVRTAQLNTSSRDMFDPLEIAEVDYPGVRVIRIVDRMSGDEVIIFDPIRRCS